VEATRIVMPQLGANEFTAIVTEWLVEAGAEVQVGTQVAVVETAKTTVELEAEAAGFIYPIVDAGEEVAIQAPLALLLEQPDAEEAKRLGDELTSEMPTTAAPSDGQPQLTRKAQALAAELGVDTSRLPTDRVVTEQDVRALGGVATGPSPVGSADNRFAVYGASDGGVYLMEAIIAMGGREVVGFLDDTEGKPGTEFSDLPVWSGDELAQLPERGVGAVATHIAVRPFRLELLTRATEAGLAMPNVVHPTAYVSQSARLGRGNVIKAGALIDTGVRLGDCCIIDNGAVVPHHNVIGDAVHIAPGVSMGGDCRIGPETLIGVGAVVSARVSIGRNVIVAPGAVVVRDVPDDVVVEGSPARVVGARRPA
jgi:sugar O-acyltransferase (sialic acid O-acetyltransferase NeuD family)